MELRTKNIFVRDGSRQRNAVVDFGGNITNFRRLESEAVHEVKVGAVWNAGEKPARLFGQLDIVPADMGDALIAAKNVQPLHFAGNEIETCMVAAFGSAAGQQLHAKTDAEQGLAATGFSADGFNPAVFGEMGHAVGETADARQDYFIRGRKLLRAFGDDGLYPEFREGMAYRSQIAHAVVDDRNLHGLS